MVHHSWGVKRFTNIFIKTGFKKNSRNWFLLENVFQSIEFLKQSIECDSYFCYYWNLWLGQLTVNSIDWMVCLINWTVTDKLFLKLIWVFKGMVTIIFSYLRLSKNIPWDFLSEIERPFCVIILFTKLFKSKNLQERESLKHPWVRFLQLWFWTKAKSSTPDLHYL